MPVRVHEMHTASTDWIADFEPSDNPNAHHASIAQAALWFARTSPEVRADTEEFCIQAEGFMRREASMHGEQAHAIYSEGLSYLGFLHRREAASGLDQIQQTVNPHEDPAPTPMDPMVFDNFAPEVHPINEGVVGNETSERNPLLQEIQGEGNGQGQPEQPGGHAVGNDGGYGEQPMDDSAGPLAMEGGEPQQQEPEEEPDQRMASWDSRSVAINHTMNMDDFRRNAASGLDQVQQIVNPHEDPSPMPLPVEVAFPWIISPDAYGSQGEQEPDEAAHTAAYEPTPNPTPVTWDKDAPKPCPECQGAMPDRNCEKCHGTGHTGSRKQGGVYNIHPKGAQVFIPSPHGVETDERGWKGNTATVIEPPKKGDASGFGGETHHLCEFNANGNQFHHHFGSRKQADMFGASDMPHAVPGPSPANTPDTTPVPQAGASYQQGMSDAQAGERPSYADASNAVQPNVSQYAKGYSDGIASKEQGQPNMPTSLNAAAKVSDRFVKAASRTNAEFTKGYGFGSKWAPGKPLVTTGSAEFESGLFAGLIDRPTHQVAWVAAHKRMAKKDPRFAARLNTYSQYVEHLTDNGISLEAAGGSCGCSGVAGCSCHCKSGQCQCKGCSCHGNKAKTAGTSSDLDTMDGAASPSLTGQTPLNGRGQPGPLAGGMDASAPGGPSPYNGSEPFGTPVVPTGPEQGQQGSQYVNDVPGGPADGNVNPTALAFRRTVQSALLASRKG